MPTTQDYSGLVSRLKFLTLPTATPDTAADYLVFLDATTGDLARALWPTGGGGGGAPTTAEYLVATSDGTLSAERVATNTSRISWDFGTAGQAKADLVAGSVSTTYLGGDITTAGKALLDDADAAAQRTTLGLGTLATQSGTFSGTSSGTNTGDQTITLTGDVTGSGTGSFAATIANGAVSLAKMANMATDSFIGRDTAGTGAPEVLSAATARSVLGLATIATTGSASDLSGGTVPTARLGTGTASSATFLRGDQTWATAIGTETVYADAPCDDVTMSTSWSDLCNQVVTIAERDTIEMEVVGTIYNNSGVVPTYRWDAWVNLMSVEVIEANTVASSATDRYAFRVRAVFSVRSTTLTKAFIESQRSQAAVATTGASIPAGGVRTSWQTDSTNNNTGSVTCKVRARSNNSTATQQMQVHSWKIVKRTKNP